MTIKTSKPDYKFWSKLDSWSCKDAALLLEGIDPFGYKLVKFTLNEIAKYPELEAAYKTYLILKNAHWKGRPLASSVNPYQICAIAIQKDLAVPEELLQFLRERYDREQENVKQAQAEAAADESLTTRERRNLLKLIAYMALIIADSENSLYQFKINGRPNACQITKAMLDKAMQLNKDIEGIKSSNRKIMEALEFLEEEC